VGKCDSSFLALAYDYLWLKWMFKPTLFLPLFSFISAENLSEMLGADFPKAEIEAIISEATGGKRDQVSYAEFLRLWGEKQESERDKMIQELTELDEENKSVSSLDYMSDVDCAEARASFLGKKISSSARSALIESPRKPVDGSKPVGFYDDVGVIPPHREADI
jgi:hypothetical protein